MLSTRLITIQWISIDKKKYAIYWTEIVLVYRQNYQESAFKELSHVILAMSKITHKLKNT